MCCSGGLDGKHGGSQVVGKVASCLGIVCATAMMVWVEPAHAHYDNGNGVQGVMKLGDVSWGSLGFHRPEEKSLDLFSGIFQRTKTVIAGNKSSMASRTRVSLSIFFWGESLLCHISLGGTSVDVSTDLKPWGNCSAFKGFQFTSHGKLCRSNQSFLSVALKILPGCTSFRPSKRSVKSMQKLRRRKK